LRSPAGAVKAKLSPSNLPIIARAIGEDTAIRFCLMSASRSPTIW
jgi:hypothetical protein